MNLRSLVYLKGTMEREIFYPVLRKAKESSLISIRAPSRQALQPFSPWQGGICAAYFWEHLLEPEDCVKFWQ